MENAAQTRASHRPFTPCTAVGKSKHGLHWTMWCWALLSFSEGHCPGPFTCLEPWQGGSAPCLDPHKPVPRSPWCPYHVTGPSFCLRPSSAPSPCPSLEHSRGLASLRLSLACRTSVQVLVKSISFLACTCPDTRHSSLPSRGSENPVSSS